VPTTARAQTTDAPVLPVPASPALTSAPAPSPWPSPTDAMQQAHGDVAGGDFSGTGTSGSLSLMSFASAPKLGAATAPEPVPAPVIAAPEGSPAGVLPTPEGMGTPLADRLPTPPEDHADEAVTAHLAAPDLANNAAADPLVDLAPAAFVLSASLGGLLMAGRRRIC
jgi:hypothetical protein